MGKASTGIIYHKFSSIIFILLLPLFSKVTSKDSLMATKSIKFLLMALGTLVNMCFYRFPVIKINKHF